MKSRRILITGASRGIGKAIAEGLAEPGRQLVLVARSVDALADVYETCEERGAWVCTVGADLARSRNVDRMLDLVLADGPVDMIVNAAGVAGEEVLPWEADPDDWWRTQEVNLRAPFLIQRRLVPPMLEQGGGRILDLSSGAAVADIENMSGYYVSKTALMRLGGCLADAGKKHGLVVLEMAPGVVRTDMTAAMKMHVGRTQWTDVQHSVDIARAFAEGLLDGLSGAQVRAGYDCLEELKERSQRGIGSDERRLRRTDFAGEKDCDG